ncbi:MAG: hypothetical protein EOP06_32700 [Proteobacteria bacterium]|nr:MAG: hypothetical protein EOP06_32700 [Pseudomonadota bacterium]
MSIKNTEWKFLITTAFLVATIAVPTLASLISVDQEVSSTTQTSSSTPTGDQRTREPASLPGLKTVGSKVIVHDAKQELNRMVQTSAETATATFQLKCGIHEKQAIEVKGNYLQLTGKNCAKNAAPPSPVQTKSALNLSMLPVDFRNKS